MKMLASIQCIQGIREDPQCGRAKDDPPKRPNEVDTKRVREAAKVETMDKVFVKEGVIGWGHVRQMARREERGTASRMIPQYCGMRENASRMGLRENTGECKNYPCR